MKTLPDVIPTPEQLSLITNPRPGVVLIRGSAGSGKTTTALLRLKQLASYWLQRRERLEQEDPIRILVITFNRTLRGYIADLADRQLRGRSDLELTVSTFAKWSKNILPSLCITDDSVRRSKISSLGTSIDLEPEFLLDEVDYLLGRFTPVNISEYLACRRLGRGTSPRVGQALRKQILDEVVYPYSSWKQSKSCADWNDLAVMIQELTQSPLYDVIITDEAQDLSANQVRALMRCAANPSSVTFVLDAAQRIYPRGFTWAEAGVTIRPQDSYRLSANHRNTAEICRFAEPLLLGLDVGDDGTFPDFQSCNRRGDKPVVLKGKYSRQVTYALDFIRERVDLSSESVAFLKPKGRRWFETLKNELGKKSYGFVELTRLAEWPEGNENIALSTMFSAKGLEFDHVIILGLNEEVTPHGDDPEDTARNNLRRLLAMAITRARESVIIGYKPAEASQLIDYLDPSTFQEVVL